MVNIRVSIFVLLLFVIAIFFFTYHTISNCSIPDSIPVENQSISNDSKLSDTSGNISVITNLTDISADDGNLVLPPRETILNGIDWSNYPLLRNPYIHNHEISDPTDIVNHKFLYVTIVAEVIDARNETEVLRQLSAATVELQKILGPDSGPNMWGTADGVWVYYAAIMPYETEVWARAFH